MSSPFDGVEVLAPEDPPDDEPDSPWTIEAVDGEGSEKEEVCGSYAIHVSPRPLIGYRFLWSPRAEPSEIVLQLQRKVVGKKFSILAILTAVSQSLPSLGKALGSLFRPV